MFVRRRLELAFACTDLDAISILLWINVIACVCIWTVHAIQIDCIFINGARLATLRVRPPSRESNPKGTVRILFDVLDLDSQELTVAIGHQIKRRVLCLWLQDHVTLQQEIKFRLHDSDIALGLCMMVVWHDSW